MEENENSKKLLITGGAGFIGSHFIKEILKTEKYSVLNIDKLTYAGNLKNLEEIKENPNYIFRKADIANQKELENIFREFVPDFVINFAAETHVDNSIDNPDPFILTNVVGTQNLLALCLKYKTKKYVQISTDEVYGSIDSGSFTEESPLKPNSPYSASKASADLLCRSYFKTFSLPISIVRCTNNFGPNQYPEKLIPYSIKRLQENKNIAIYGNGKNIRDWIYVEDFAKAIKLVLEKGKIGEIYNVGSGNELNNIQIAEKILEVLNLEKNRIEFIKDRLGHDLRYSLDFTKINKELGWKPSFNFDEKFRDTVKWFEKEMK